MARIAEDADEDIVNMKNSLRYEIKAAKEGQSEEQRQEELKRLSRESINKAREQQERRGKDTMERKKITQDNFLDNFRREQKDLHDSEVELLKNRYQQKLAIEKERMA